LAGFAAMVAACAVASAGSDMHGTRKNKEMGWRLVLVSGWRIAGR
jgi:hypothetical protein